MRWLNILLLAAALLTGYGLTLYLDGTAIRPSYIATQDVSVPDFSFTDIRGKTYSLADFHGKIVLINFWATWCPPCVVEFPELLKIAAANSDKLVLIALSSDTGDDAIKTFLQKQETPAPNVYIARDSEEITLKLFGITQLPETILTGRDLRQREKLVGANWDPEVLQKILDSL